MSKVYLGGAGRDAPHDGGGGAATRFAHILTLAAAPTFAGMAALAAFGVGPPDTLCVATPYTSPLTGMVVMYGLMSVFHAAPWLKVIARRRTGARRVWPDPVWDRGGPAAEAAVDARSRS